MSADREAAELKALIREAHEATKDLRDAIKAAREYEAKLGKEVVEERVTSELERCLTETFADIEKAVVTTKDEIFDRFDLLAALMLGDDKKSQRAGLPPVDELIRRYRERTGRGDTVAIETRPK